MLRQFSSTPLGLPICSGGGTVDFQEFVGGLSAFSSRGGREEKLRCAYHPTYIRADANPGSLLLVVAFKVYDMDRDGFISNGELFLVLKMMVGNNLKVWQSCTSYRYEKLTLTGSAGPPTTTNR